MAIFDTVTKEQARTHPMDFVNYHSGRNHAPTFYYRILERKAAAEARQQGVRENTREKILEALELRLQPDAAHVFKPILEQIDDLSRLNELFRAAIQVDGPEAFRRVLEANGN